MGDDVVASELDGTKMLPKWGIKIGRTLGAKG